VADNSNQYILNRLRSDAAALLARSQVEEGVPHAGTRGRFRELLIDNMLSPWLPPYVACGTGMILDRCSQPMARWQNDIILYDRSLAPPMLAAAGHAPEGVFIYNSVLASIEVKSTLTATGVEEFVASSREISNLKITVGKESARPYIGAINLLFFSNPISRGTRRLNFND
jgi:hypothetical protein